MTASNSASSGSAVPSSSGAETNTGVSELTSDSPRFSTLAMEAVLSLSISRRAREAARWSARAAFQLRASRQRMRSGPAAMCAPSASRYSASSFSSFAPSFMARKSSPEIIASSTDCHQDSSSSASTASVSIWRCAKSSSRSPSPASESCSAISVRSGSSARSSLRSTSAAIRSSSCVIGISRRLPPARAGSIEESLSMRAPASW